MYLKEILFKYINGELDTKNALEALKAVLPESSTSGDTQKAARARYIIGFIRRVSQYNNGSVSAKDLCLNIRDIVLIFGRLQLSEILYDIVRKFGNEFDLVCESNLEVSCMLRTPKWLKPEHFIKDVYAFKQNHDIEMEITSPGDKMLSTHTLYQNYKSFEQKIAVQTALNLPFGHTLLISLPTGGGKSLVTQLLSSTAVGLTIVIVPTVALALDQYYSAQRYLKNTTEIYCYRGEQSSCERKIILTALKNQKAQVLFTSPEAILRNLELRNFLDESAKSHYLENVIVDEAHVVPDWGVFFRPDFQLFSILLKKWRRDSNDFIRTFLLSATLPDDVVETLFILFGEKGKDIQVRCDSLRQEPRFYFQSVSSIKEQDDKTLEAIKLLPKPMVIYVLEPREAKSLQKKLLNSGYKNIPVFSGETNESDRDTVLTGWKNHDFDVVIATSAFGIGVDKPDVRTIIHACCPESLSRFYQEVGRSGRDRLPSISLFMPYQSKDGSDSDVRRARGLINKRVLTVERAVIRWKSMLTNPGSMIYADECVLDTSATPSTMSDEEAEFAGNRNVAWNINLLLFLYRTGFIDLLDTNYVYDKKSNSSKQFYTVTVKLRKHEILSDDNLLREELLIPREKEYEAQMHGYNIVRSLIYSPKAKCWGKVFKHLFPLSREVCNGCPIDPEGRVTTDELYKLRTNPEVLLPPAIPSKRLERNMSSFRQLHVKRPSTGSCSGDEVSVVAQKAEQNNIGVLVAPRQLLEHLNFDGILLSYEEFNYVVSRCPYLFAKGTICIFDNDKETNYILYKNLSRLDAFEYRKILYYHENDVLNENGKPIRDYCDGYTIPLEKL